MKQNWFGLLRDYVIVLGLWVKRSCLRLCGRAA